MITKISQSKTRNGIWNARLRPNGAIYKRGKFRNYFDATRSHKAGIIIVPIDDKHGHKIEVTLFGNR